MSSRRKECGKVAEGTVKWFDNRKGYGFIQTDGREEDIFVHYSVVEMSGLKTLEEGEKVAFELIESEKGLRAQNVHRLQQPAG